MSPDALISKSRLAALLARQFMRPLSDKNYLKIRYFFRFARWPDYESREDFNECIHEYMLRCRDPLLKVVADKHAVRKYISDTVGDQYLVPCLGVWDSAETVPFHELPRPFVLKATIGSGMNLFFHKDTDQPELEVRNTMRKWMDTDFSRWNREWCYEGSQHRIMAERMLVTPSGCIPSDIKFYVVGGKVRFIQVDRDRFGRHTRNLYSAVWDLLPVRLTKKNHPLDARPERLEEMVTVAETVAQPFEFLRVDYYCVNGEIKIGELTNYSGSGFETFIPASFGAQLADWWKEKPCIE